MSLHSCHPGSNASCPLCGSKISYVGLNSIECSGIGCANYVAQKIEKIDWEKAYMELKEIAKKINKDMSGPGPIGPVQIQYIFKNTP